MKQPFVSIIIVNYNGKHLLAECFGALSKLTYPSKNYEVIMVDNNSSDDSIPFTKKNYPSVIIIQSEKNNGFSGGNTLGLEKAKGEYIVLLNSDVQVDPGWLTALVKAAEDPKVGIISSRLRFAVPFFELQIKSQAFPRSQIDASTDHSPVGVLLEDVTCQEKKYNQSVYYRKGFYDRKIGEVGTRRLTGDATIALPFPINKDTFSYTFTVHGFESGGPSEIPVELKIGDKQVANFPISPFEVKQVRIILHKNDVVKYLKWYVQNAGNIVMKSGYSKDRGSLVDFRDGKIREFYEEESEYFLQPAKLLAACGAGCLIKREVIDHVGFLDGYYFMYYEDVELSLRAWRAGWQIVYEPSAIGYHQHRATTGNDESAFFIEQTERNHLAMVISHFPAKIVVKQLVIFMLQLSDSFIKFMLYQFRDNMERTRSWHNKLEGRKAVLFFLIQSFPRLINTRLNLNREWPMDRKAMDRMSY